MIAHIVQFKFYDGWGWEHPDALAAEATSLSHIKHIPGIELWNCKRCVVSRNACSDFIIFSAFSDAEAYINYLNHPHHLNGVKQWRAISAWSVADFEIESSILPYLQNL